jgi:hypothetical protein
MKSRKRRKQNTGKQEEVEESICKTTKLWTGLVYIRSTFALPFPSNVQLTERKGADFPKNLDWIK